MAAAAGAVVAAVGAVVAAVGAAGAYLGFFFDYILVIIAFSKSAIIIYNIIILVNIIIIYDITNSNFTHIFLFLWLDSI